MTFKDGFTTQKLKAKDSIKEKDKIEISDVEYLNAELQENNTETLKALRHTIMKRI